ncbi:MAG TPA: hypothetical protein VHX43_16705 [Xanthobacteraceae bacterium]|jgi:hypothetical protein|nr:hypothetical protein [Xanthobacteraceae bacterium]
MLGEARRRRQVIFNDIEDHLRVDVVIRVTEEISETYHPLPIDIFPLRFDLVQYVADASQMISRARSTASRD